MNSARPRFFLPLRVRFADTDLQGHVFFANYLTYFDEALMAYLREIGCDWRTLAREGVELYYVSTNSEHLGRAFSEELLHVHAGIVGFGNSSLKLGTSVHRAEDGSILAKGQITAVVVDRDSGETVPVPNRLRRAVERYEGVEQEL